VRKTGGSDPGGCGLLRSKRLINEVFVIKFECGGEVSLQNLGNSVVYPAIRWMRRNYIYIKELVASVAQLVEHLHGKEGVIGSSPIGGYPEDSRNKNSPNQSPLSQGIAKRADGVLPGYRRVVPIWQCENYAIDIIGVFLLYWVFDYEDGATERLRHDSPLGLEENNASQCESNRHIGKDRSGWPKLREKRLSL
jgi:hypothetical protein